MLCLKSALKGGRTWWVAPRLSIADEGWRKLTSQAMKINRAGGKAEIHLGDRTVTFEGGGEVQVRTASEPHRLRGAALHGVVLDECAFMPQETWSEVLRPSLADHRGWALFISTPFGYDNWFFDLWERVPGRDNWERFQIPTSANPRIDEAELKEMAEGMLPHEYAQEVLAEFTVPGGETFKQDWFRYYQENEGLYILGDTAWHSEDCWRFSTVDLAVSTKETADYTVVSTWGVTPDSDLILLDVVRARLEGPDIVPRMQAVYDLYKPGYMAVERVGFQLSLLQHAQRTGLPIRELRADKDKLARARPLQSRMQAGRVWFPRDKPWIREIESEMLAFPRSAHDDFVDTASYAAIEIGGSIVVDLDNMAAPEDPFGMEEFEREVATLTGDLVETDEFGFEEP